VLWYAWYVVVAMLLVGLLVLSAAGWLLLWTSPPIEALGGFGCPVSLVVRDP
jgi:hypothetical protein